MNTKHLFITLIAATLLAALTCRVHRAPLAPCLSRKQLFTRARTAHKAHDYATARALYRALTARAPHHPIYWHNLAETFLEQDDYQGAIEPFEQAISQEKQAPQSYLRLALCYEKLGCYDDAHQTLERLFALDRDYPLPPKIRRVCHEERERLALQARLNRAGGKVTMADITRLG